MRAEYRRLVRTAVRAGWTVKQSKAGHLKWRSPAGQLIVSGSTPSCRRAWANLVASLRQAGLTIPR